MAGNQKPSDRRGRSRRKSAEPDDWLEQFAPTAPAGSPRASSPTSVGAPDPRSRVPGPRPGEVPGSRGLDAELHEAALRELGLDGPPRVLVPEPHPQATQVAPGTDFAPEAEPVLDHGMSREDLSDWLEEFAPVADPGEEPEGPRRSSGRYTQRGDTDGVDKRRDDRGQDDRGHVDRAQADSGERASNRSNQARTRSEATDQGSAIDDPDPVWSADPTTVVDAEPGSRPVGPNRNHAVSRPTGAEPTAAAPSPDPNAIIAAPPPVSVTDRAKGPDLADILRVDGDIVPGTTIGATASPTPRPAALPVDWNAPLVWSNDDTQDPMSPERPDELAPMSDLRELGSTGQPAAVASDAAITPANEPVSPAAQPDARAWPAPPPLDENGVPVMTPITSWSPAEPVAWGWAEAWPEGTPADWHTQSLPVSPEPPLVDAPVVQELEELPAPPPPPHDPVADVVPSWAEPELETSPPGAGMFDVSLPGDVPIVADAPVATDADPEWTEPSPGFSLPGLPADPQLLQPATPVAWAEDLPLPDNRPAPPPLPGTTNYAGGRLQSANEINLQWNDAIADQSPDLTAPAPPKEWGSNDFFDASEVVTSGSDESTSAQDDSGPADFQPDVSPYHDRITPDGATTTDPLGSTNVDNPQDASGSDPAGIFGDVSKPSEGLAPLDPGATDWAPVGLESPAVADVPHPPAMAGQPSSLPDPGLPVLGADVPAGGLGDSFGESAGAVSQGAFAPSPDPALAVAGAPNTNFEPARLDASDLPSARPQAPQGTMAQLRANPATRLLLEWVPLLLGAFVVAMLVRFFVFQAYYIPSGSMIPTLEVKDRVLVNKLSYDFHDVNRGDIVVFKRPEGTEGNVDDLIKRVMGLPGETLIFRNGDVYVDGQLVEESYIQEQDSTFPIAGIPGCAPAGTSSQCTVPEGHVFVMGDNRRGSTDGRVFGPIDQDTIVGRAFVKVWPILDFGFM